VLANALASRPSPVPSSHAHRQDDQQRDRALHPQPERTERQRAHDDRLGGREQTERQRVAAEQFEPPERAREQAFERARHPLAQQRDRGHEEYRGQGEERQQRRAGLIEHRAVMGVDQAQQRL